MARSRVAVVGLGKMGRAIARRLHAAGHRLTVYNRTQSRANSLLQLGAELAETPQRAAESADVIITLVADDEAMRSVALGKQGLVAGMAVGKTLIEMSTLTESAIEDIYKKVRKAGGLMLHAPILGGPMEVFTGAATIVAGGPKSTFQSVLPILEAISKPVHYIGGNLTHGTRMKMALNIMLTHYFTGLSSSLAFARRGDLPAHLVHDILARIAGGVVERLGKKMLSGERGVTFTMKNLAKDQGYFLEASERLGLDLPTIRAARELFDKVVEEGYGDEDFTAVYRFILENAEEGAKGEE